MKENVTTRVAPEFEAELIEIKEKRIKGGMDKKKVSDRKLTKMIPRHELWEKIKEDLINFDFIKREKEMIENVSG